MRAGVLRCAQVHAGRHDAQTTLKLPNSFIVKPFKNQRDEYLPLGDYVEIKNDNLIHRYVPSSGIRFQNGSYLHYIKQNSNWYKFGDEHKSPEKINNDELYYFEYVFFIYDSTQSSQ